MNRALVFWAILISTPPAASAREPRVGVPIYRDDIGCSSATIYYPDRPQTFVSIRSGPSQREQAIAWLRHDDVVFACIRRGNWFGIVFDRPGQRSDCGVRRPWPATHRYPGPCRSGWVHDHHIAGYADWVSP